MRQEPGHSSTSWCAFAFAGTAVFLMLAILSPVSLVGAADLGVATSATADPATAPSTTDGSVTVRATPDSSAAVQPAAALTADSVSLGASSTLITVGSAVWLTGHTSSTAARQRVYLTRRQAGQTSWHSVTSTLTASGGTFRFRVGPQCISGYRAKWQTATDELTINARANLGFKVDSYITWGDAAALKVYLRGRVRGGIHVHVLYKNSSMDRWAMLRDTDTSDSGGVYTSSSPVRNTAYVAQVRDNHYVASDTTARPVKVRPRLTLAVSRTTAHVGNTISLSGKLTPKEQHSVVSLQTSSDGATWHQIARPTVSDTSGAYRAYWQPNAKATLWVRVAVPHSSDMTAASSLYLPNKRVFPVGGRLGHEGDRLLMSWDRLGWTRQRAWLGLVHHDYPASDIMAPHGFPVYSTVGGVVRKADHDGESSSGGNDVTIAGNDRRVYYYAHLMTINRSIVVGKRIAAGRQIGTVGCSGNASHDAPHLHFGVSRPGGTIKGEIDPYPLLDPAWVKVFVRTPAYIARKVTIQ